MQPAAHEQVLRPVDEAVRHDVQGHDELFAADPRLGVVREEGEERAERERVDDDAEVRLRSLISMARDNQELFAVSEGLLDHDEAVARWRYLHVLMVEREIGAKRGTGGSSGVGYLKSTLDKRFFPELWGLRSHL